MTGSLETGTQQPQPDETDISRDEVQALIQSARRASEAGDDIVPRLDQGDGEVADPDQAEEEEDDNLEPGYWEASGMAPLNATSLVSAHVFHFRSWPLFRYLRPEASSALGLKSTPDMVYLCLTTTPLPVATH